MNNLDRCDEIGGDDKRMADDAALVSDEQWAYMFELTGEIPVTEILQQS